MASIFDTDKIKDFDSTVNNSELTIGPQLAEPFCKQAHQSSKVMKPDLLLPVHELGIATYAAEQSPMPQFVSTQDTSQELQYPMMLKVMTVKETKEYHLKRLYKCH